MTEDLVSKEKLSPTQIAEKFVNQMVDADPQSERFGQFLGEEGILKEGEIRGLITHYVWSEGSFPDTPEGHHQTSVIAFEAYNKVLQEQKTIPKTDPFEIQAELTKLEIDKEAAIRTQMEKIPSNRISADNRCKNGKTNRRSPTIYR